MIEIKAWMKHFCDVLGATFGDRVWFVGLQGSYGRGEANVASDIDVVVILDQLTIADIKAYNDMLDTLPNRELICGFVSGRNELLSWEPSDLFQFLHDTTPIKGSLDDLLSVMDEDAVNRTIKLGACNIYHGCVHNMLHEKSCEILRGLYKSASFVVQAVVFRRNGRYCRHMRELLEAASADERRIIETFLHLKSGGEPDFSEMSEALFKWVKELIENK